MRFEAHIRTPPPLDASAARPFVDQLIEDPGDGEIVAQESHAEEGTVRVAFEADSADDADLHARLLAERAQGCVVLEVRQA